MTKANPTCEIRSSMSSHESTERKKGGGRERSGGMDSCIDGPRMFSREDGGFSKGNEWMGGLPQGAKGREQPCVVREKRERLKFVLFSFLGSFFVSPPLQTPEVQCPKSSSFAEDPVVRKKREKKNW
ncbi:hypothetical protein SODALDRAFT_163277 [Sodiomyces alkalinus F11]|uniref:Uncharacterized protein n=1 Tax=Sodiomyces alkalinus (strain CBS 110278 / VKM F-3762 / F11) TaxID=1314773 RepID=A0A3N2PVG1_SODAK|nr:hypothetical protein SODALDRAFT_163277 [Sodiomyces alkalinus F11]ROT38480.1 hypothetical protein SODALDRAFT_163277 [Sodiomyces alkalinus F11]